ncbi:hypothetical protein CEXT_791271 [Caerostris extrusa]|uniref:Uncharacterized protein n=1 Tax=Caerostris extrusa TaxID=172846 RepID=A0AAV4P4S7_CAEEX|nr:hypothetical protein CEXT_791271 [Caerostris extrusa]
MRGLPPDFPTIDINSELLDRNNGGTSEKKGTVFIGNSISTTNNFVPVTLFCVKCTGSHKSCFCLKHNETPSCCVLCKVDYAAKFSGCA